MSEWTPGSEPAQPKNDDENQNQYHNDTVENRVVENDTVEIGASVPELPVQVERTVPERTVPERTEPAVPPTAPARVTPGPEAGSVPRRRGVRIGTIVFGAVMLVISVVCLLALTTSVQVDGTAIGLALLLGAGAALVAGGAASAVREARGGPGAAR